MDFNKLCGFFLFALFFIDCILAARYGVLPFLAALIVVPLALFWCWYLKPAEPAVQLQRIKFGTVYLFVEVA